MKPGSFLPAALLFLTMLLMMSSCGSPGAANPDQSIKIYVEESGVVCFSAGQAGWTSFPPEIRLSAGDGDLPYWLNGKGSSPELCFFAPPNQSNYENSSVFLLHPGQKGPLLSAEELPLILEPGTPGRASMTRVWDEDRLYEPLAVDNPWLAERLIAPGELTIPLQIHSPRAGEATLRVTVWGKSSAAEDPDHRMRLTLNGEVIAEHAWDGQGFHTAVIPFPGRLLRQGTNPLTISALEPRGDFFDIFYLDRVELTYRGETRAENDRLRFKAQGSSVSVSAFSAPPIILDITNPENPRRLVSDQLPDEFSFKVEDGHDYLLVGPRGTITPSRFVPLQDQPDLTGTDLAADYLVIGPEEFLPSARPLLERREEQGLAVLAVPLEAVVDQFGGGEMSPDAVRSFLVHASQNWNPAPRYVLLLGDASYDPRGKIYPPRGNILPTYFINTGFGGQTASDILMAQINDPQEDPWPDLAVGRFPARTAEQVQVLVEKTLLFEEEVPRAAWNRRVLAVADSQEAYFAEDAQRFVDKIGDAYQFDLLTPPAGQADANQAITGKIEQGVLLVAYFGHGSLKIWGKDTLFSREDSTALQNSPALPVIFNFTCLTGLFTHPLELSLAESFLWNPRGGAVAVVAPSSLTLPGTQTFLSDAVAAGFSSRQETRLGDIMLSAWRSVPVTKFDSQDVMNTFMLFGDPALLIIPPELP